MYVTTTFVINVVYAFDIHIDVTTNDRRYIMNIIITLSCLSSLVGRCIVQFTVPDYPHLSNKRVCFVKRVISLRRRKTLQLLRTEFYDNRYDFKFSILRYFFSYYPLLLIYGKRQPVSSMRYKTTCMLPPRLLSMWCMPLISI
jgi:hypothetical protein